MLDAKQQVVVDHEGGALVLAGAGSGKTRTMVSRIARLLDDGINPRRIVAVSFTKKASEELKERLLSQHAIGAEVTCRTLHSLSFSALTKNGLLERNGARMTLIDNRSSYAYMTELAKQFKWRTEEPLTVIPKTISQAKEQAFMRGSAQYNDYIMAVGDDIGVANFLAICKGYEEKKAKGRHIDFTDMQYLLWEALLEDKRLFERLAHAASHFMVDEVQDLNPLQIELVDLLSQSAALMLIGDIRQSIYGFRGSAPSSVLAFAARRDLPTLFLDNNYRSKSEIVELGNTLIAQGEIERNLAPSVAFNSDGADISASLFCEDFDQARYFARLIKAKIEEGHQPGEIAILARINAQLAPMQVALRREGVPFYVSGQYGFFERKEIMDAVAYLRLCDNPTDALSLDRVYNTPTRFLGKVFKNKFDEMRVNTDSVLATLEDVSDTEPRFRSAIDNLSADLTGLFIRKRHGATTAELLEAILKLRSRSNGKTFLELYRSDDDSDNSREENLEQLMDLAADYPVLSDFLAMVEEQLSPQDAPDPDRVQLMTIHRSKGLEYDTVFILDYNEGLYPHGRGDSEEERRVSYVALTRARQSLHIGAVSYRFGKSVDVSPYLDVLGLDVTPITVGNEE